jgi:hypothetical protein
MKRNNLVIKTSLAALGLFCISVTGSFAEESFAKTAISSTTISGFVDTSAIVNFGNNTVVGRTIDTTDTMDGFNFHMANLTLSSEPVGSGEVKAGYTVELLFGPAANKLGSTSLISSSTGVATGTSADDGDDFAVKQAYIDLFIPVGESGLSLQMGTWDTIVGYEVFNSAGNPNFSRSFAFFLEPFVHTGIKGSYEISESIAINFGVADAYTSSINGRPMNANPAFDPSVDDGTVRSGDLTYLGALSLTMPEDGPLAGANLYVGAAHGASVGASSQDTLYYAGLTVPVSDLISVGFSNDYVDYDTGDGYANATSFYLSLFATDQLSFHNRLEWAKSDVAIWGGGNAAGDEEYLGETFTIQYDIFENVLTRLEARWDHAMEGTPYGADLNNDNSFSLMANVVYLF